MAGPRCWSVSSRGGESSSCAGQAPEFDHQQRRVPHGHQGRPVRTAHGHGDLAHCPAATPKILICGLGVGFALAEAVSQARVAQVDVVEISAEIIGWHGTHLRHLAAPAWEDGRVHVINADMVAWLARQQGPYDVICLDIDNGPEWTVWEANQALYGDEGLRRVRDSLRPGRRDLGVERGGSARLRGERLQHHFSGVHAYRVPVSRGQPDVVYLAKRVRCGV